MKETIEKFPGVEGEIFLIRVVENLFTKVAEINLLNTEGDEEKTTFVRNEPFPIHEDTEKILTITKTKIQLRNTIKKEARIDIFNEQLSN